MGRAFCVGLTINKIFTTTLNLDAEIPRTPRRMILPYPIVHVIVVHVNGSVTVSPPNSVHGDVTFVKRAHSARARKVTALTCKHFYKPNIAVFAALSYATV
jgi:hypothetical protein